MKFSDTNICCTNADTKRFFQYTWFLKSYVLSFIKIVFKIDFLNKAELKIYNRYKWNQDGKSEWFTNSNKHDALIIFTCATQVAVIHMLFYLFIFPYEHTGFIKRKILTIAFSKKLYFSVELTFLYLWFNVTLLCLFSNSYLSPSMI